MSDRLSKLLAYALDPAASEGEAENAGIRAIREMRRLGISPGQVLAVGTPPPPTMKIVYREQIVFRVPPGDMIFKFGKYAGSPIGEIFTFDPGYVRWFGENATRADPALIRAARQLTEDDL